MWELWLLSSSDTVRLLLLISCPDEEPPLELLEEFLSTDLLFMIVELSCEEESSPATSSYVSDNACSFLSIFSNSNSLSQHYTPIEAVTILKPLGLIVEEKILSSLLSLETLCEELSPPVTATDLVLGKRTIVCYFFRISPTTNSSPSSVPSSCV